MTSLFDDNICIVIVLETAMLGCPALGDVMLLVTSGCPQLFRLPVDTVDTVFIVTLLMYNSAVVNNRYSFHFFGRC